MYIDYTNFAVQLILYNNTMNKTVLIALMLLVAANLSSQVCETTVDGKKLEKEKMEKTDYIPAIHGTIRAKYEYQIATNENRFQVRNARFSITGNVLPIVAYKAEIDLSDQGTIRMLDAYTRIFPVKHIDFTIGQMRVPFTIDAHRSPHLLFFANRSFIAKQVGDVRDVGATLAYSRKDFALPFVLEGGVFSGAGLINQKEWRKTLNYSLKGQLGFAKGFNLVLSNQMIKPEDITIQMYDIGINFNNKKMHLEAEYLYKTYSNGAHEAVHAFNTFASYYIPLKKIFHQMSLGARYDMMTDHSDGRNFDKETSLLPTTDFARHRITGGITFSFTKLFTADIRLNYEKYFYQGGTPKASEQDKIVIEFMTRF